MVKQQLTAGETRAAYARVDKVKRDDKIELDEAQASVALLTAYLLDWSFPEYPIRGKSVAEVTSALDALDLDSFNEILTAVQAHDTAAAATRAKARQDPLAATASSPISLSVA